MKFKLNYWKVSMLLCFAYFLFSSEVGADDSCTSDPKDASYDYFLNAGPSFINVSADGGTYTFWVRMYDWNDNKVKGKVKVTTNAGDYVTFEGGSHGSKEYSLNKEATVKFTVDANNSKTDRDFSFNIECLTKERVQTANVSARQVGKK